jgi:hypothetical protein
MSAKPVIKRVKLPLSILVSLRREARRQRRSVSALVGEVLRRDLDSDGARQAAGYARKEGKT